MATLLKADDQTGKGTDVQPANGHYFTIDELQQFVAGYVEVLGLKNGSLLYMNEDGKRLGLRYNLAATAVAIRWGGIALSDSVCGDVVIVKRDDQERMDAIQLREEEEAERQDRESELAAENAWLTAAENTPMSGAEARDDAYERWLESLNEPPTGPRPASFD